MKPEHLKKRLDKNRAMIDIAVRIPVDVVEDMERIAPLLGFSGYQALLKAYVGQGLRRDLKVMEDCRLVDSFPNVGNVRAKQAASYLGIGISTFWKYVAEGRVKKTC